MTVEQKDFRLVQNSLLSMNALTVIKFCKYDIYKYLQHVFHTCTDHKFIEYANVLS